MGRHTRQGTPVASAAALAVLLAAAGFAAPARADVLVMDSAGGGDFTTLPAAITAAAEGDTILVRPPGDPSLDFWTVNGKSLVLVGDVPPGSTKEVFLGSGTVRNLAAGQQVVLRNLKLDAVFPTAALTVKDNAGSVWAEDCDFHGGRGVSSAWFFCAGSVDAGGAGIAASACASVTLLRCQLAGGPGSDAFLVGGTPFVATDGGPGARIVSSNVAIHGGGTVGGPEGGGLFCGVVGAPGTGMELLSAQVLLSGTEVHGGVSGGDGLHLDATSSLERLDTLVQGDGSGADLVDAGGSLADYPGLARSLELDSPVREGQAGTLSLHGAQGDFVGYFWSFTGASIPMPKRNGWFLLDPAGFLAGPFFLGQVFAPDGSWEIPFIAPALLPALQGQTFLLQAWFQYPGGVTLGSGSAFTLLDAAF